MNPTQQNFWRMVLGQRWCATDGSVCITLVAQNATTATVHIDIGSIPHKPSRPVAARVQ
jgi:hypothetical protein